MIIPPGHEFHSSRGAAQLSLKKISLIGVGLIGGSWMRAIRQANECQTIMGCGRQLENLEKAKQLGVIDDFTHDPAEAVEQADLVVLAVPLGAIENIVRKIKPVLSSKTIITDVGSAKGSVVDAVKNVYGFVPTNFVPGHPIAGTEQSGVEASFVTLFNNRRVILTPLENTSEQALSLVKHLWQVAGAEVIEMGVEHHDSVLAATSHLPHLLAYTLVDMLAHMESNSEIFKYAAGGFRDFTRIASSDPTMWHDICLANDKALLPMLEQYIEQLQTIKEAVSNNDSESMMKVFQHAKESRDKFVG
ncbi:MAG: prephenate dehydrogenase/arogenate dehydrogenase family protein [Methylococcales bacterium]|nr:prephenate dehydrogenase/arogenate dehydrogenase family protein [Methylococcales bacterium]